MGSRKKNWDLYPSCLREMARVCRPGSGKAVLLTQDKKCFSKVTVELLQKSGKLTDINVNDAASHRLPENSAAVLLAGILRTRPTAPTEAVLVRNGCQTATN